MDEMRRYLSLVTDKPIPRYGDWNEYGSIGTTTATVHKLYWDRLTDLNIEDLNLVISKLKNQPTYVVGEPLSDGKFRRFCYLETEPYQHGSELGYEPLFSIRDVMVARSVLGLSAGKALYGFVASELGPIMSDWERHYPFRHLWASLSRDPEFHVDVVNLDSKTVVQKNATLTHGPENNDYNERYWSEDLVKEPFRFVLRAN